ncbi:hypothetical protein KC19_11G121600 [Ceratodon purpureus]|uniref:Uncharacterized protein n=1 Tax=Ceratodon purpureus TaxID=3225 RepID=A0A8T0GGP8_CERPU|nr:hypothetical protein KC19_11G121600 [Ceratodon purpureus]
MGSAGGRLELHWFFVDCFTVPASYDGNGRNFTATSPTGRFADGAAAIDGLFVSHIEVQGKNIFYVSCSEEFCLGLSSLLMISFASGWGLGV